MTSKQRERLIEEFEHERRFLWKQISDSIVDLIEKVLKEDGCTHIYEKGRCPHDGCENYKGFEKEGDDAYVTCWDGCNHRKSYFSCVCPCHTPSSAKVELPFKLPTYSHDPNDTCAANRNKINAILDYLSAKEKEHGN